jgi:hypothetical protein
MECKNRGKLAAQTLDDINRVESRTATTHDPVHCTTNNVRHMTVWESRLIRARTPSDTCSGEVEISVICSDKSEHVMATAKRRNNRCRFANGFQQVSFFSLHILQGAHKNPLT